MASTAKTAAANAPRDTQAPTDPVRALLAQGQSLWLDYITRDLVRGGGLRRLIEADGIRGETSNPTIFGKAIASDSGYDQQIKELVAQGKDAEEIFEALAVTDIQEACDHFRPLYDETQGQDGFVSIEVSPGRARDTQGTLVEARRLWQSVARPNVMVKVPGTSEGAPAVERLLAEGLNINITLLFSRRNHERVMQAYLNALEQRLAAGRPIDRIASVASYFVSRVDTLIDGLLEQKIAAAAGDPAKQERLRGLMGKAAIANAKLAYAQFRALFDGERFAPLKARSARVQRPLWASTGTKNPAYSDVLYVEELIGPDTVNTLPQATLKAVQDHGRVRRTVDQDLDRAQATLAALADVGIDLDAATQQLEDEGVALFAKSYDELIAEVQRKREALRQQVQGAR